MATSKQIHTDYIDTITKYANGISVDKDIKLTDDEKRVLKSVPKSVWKRIDKILGAYKPQSGYDVRRELVLKGIAQMLLNTEAYKESYSIGKENGKLYSGSVSK